MWGWQRRRRCVWGLVGWWGSKGGGGRENLSLHGLTFIYLLKTVGPGLSQISKIRLNFPLHLLHIRFRFLLYLHCVGYDSTDSLAYKGLFYVTPRDVLKQVIGFNDNSTFLFQTFKLPLHVLKKYLLTNFKSSKIYSSNATTCTAQNGKCFR